jgi:hypothetical protein
MWRTSLGTRVLHGSERALFETGLSYLWDAVETGFTFGESFGVGLPLFDTLQPGQQVALLAVVGEGLLDASCPPPPLTAHHETGVAAVFTMIADALVEEIDYPTVLPRPPGDLGWRVLVEQACREHPDEDRAALAQESESESVRWRLLVEGLADRILWDEDYLMGETFLDSNPTLCEESMRLLQLPRDYYVTVVPDPSDKQLGLLRQTLARLLRRPPPLA